MDTMKQQVKKLKKDHMDQKKAVVESTMGGCEQIHTLMSWTDVLRDRLVANATMLPMHTVSNALKWFKND